MSFIARTLERWLPARGSLFVRGDTSAVSRQEGAFDVAGQPHGALVAKGSRVGPLIAMDTLGAPVWAPRDYGAFAREGFMQNAVVYRSVRMIAEAAASIPLLLYEGDREVEAHPLLDLMRAPSADHTGVDFLESWYGFLLVAGNAYVEAVALDGEIRELHILRPDRMKVIPGLDGWPEGYEYTAGGRSVRFIDEPVAGVRPILHVKLFHPHNDHYGMSPIEAAATAIDIHNAASGWNKALLDNSARPSGALVYAGAQGQMTEEQFARLKSELETNYQGAAHAGRPMLLEGGLDWRPLSLSPKDMDFIEAKNAAAREIALAIGVPPMLLGIPGDNTYSNYAEAQRVFWRGTVLPLVNRTARALANWLAPSFAPSDSAPRSRPEGAFDAASRPPGAFDVARALELRPSLDDVEAFASEREALWRRLEGVSFLTEDEKRAAAGYGSQGAANDGNGPFVGAGEAGFKYRPDQPRVPAGSPDGGQWTDAGGVSLGDGGSPRHRVRAERVQVAQVAGGGRPARTSIRARFPQATPAQEVRWAVSDVAVRDAIARAQERIPGYRPRASLTSTIEGEIARNEADAREAERALVEADAGSLTGGAGHRLGGSVRTLEEVCLSNGRLIGTRYRGAGERVRTVSSEDFDNLVRELTLGSSEIAAPASYEGLWFRRETGETIGIRRSRRHGLTIDVVDSLGHPILGSNTRIHRHD